MEKIVQINIGDLYYLYIISTSIIQESPELQPKQFYLRSELYSLELDSGL